MATPLPVLALTLLLALGAAAQSTGGKSPAEPEGRSAATAVMHDRQGRSVGVVALTETPGGLLVRGSLQGLPAGPHAIHLHETGRCEPPFTSAGGHFNPAHRTHGVLDPGGMHGGDLPNLVVPASGKLDFETFAPGLTLAPGPSSVFDADGTAIVIHAKRDDYRTQPAGDAGDRIACGIVAR